MSLKQQTISGLTWSFIDNFSNIGIQFIIGIILARLLSPSEFGLIGMITIFISVSQSFIDSGFSHALIRKQDCTQSDYSTVFFFNMIVGLLFYLILFFSANAISLFYNEPILKELIQVLGFTIIIGAFTIIQRTRLTKEINFKLQTRISVIASIGSGVIGIIMAYYGFGVWSLVWKMFFQTLINSLLLWIWNKWIPSLIFDIKAFKQFFYFGYKILLGTLISTIYQNVYYLIIGKFFTASQLGYYTRAEQFSKLPSSNITGVIQRVSYPILSQLQGDPIMLKRGYKRLIKTTMFISFVLMLGMSAVATPLVLTLIGAKWSSSVLYLQLLCFSYMFYPLHVLNLNVLNVKGRSDLTLRLELLKTFLVIPIIIVGIFFGIKAMLFGVIIISFLVYFLNSYWTEKLIDYSVKEQLGDILPSFLLALFMGIVVFGLGYLLPYRPVYMLFIQIIAGAFITITLSQLFRLDGYIEIREIVIGKLPALNRFFHANR